MQPGHGQQYRTYSVKASPQRVVLMIIQVDLQVEPVTGSSIGKVGQGDIKKSEFG